MKYGVFPGGKLEEGFLDLTCNNLDQLHVAM